MSQFEKKDLKRIAQLSRLEISESECNDRLKEFNDIVGYIEKLGKLSMKDIEPTFQVSSTDKNLGTPFAADTPKTSFATEQVLKNAPQKQDTFFQ